jgi:exopolysaccharide biosynthesis polyprenyl glycosylphosphotransferase
MSEKNAQFVKRNSIRVVMSRIFGGRGKMVVWRISVATTYFVKRMLDIVVSLAMIILLIPLFVVVAILIKCESKGGVIYRQIRVGKDGRHFNFYKFRSMFVDAEKRKSQILGQNESSDGVIFKMKKDPRITRVGRFIRKYSIDELPQLFNVLEGSMSLVGPRPPLPTEVAQYTLDERKRLHIKPGITCIWQVSGRSDIPFKKQVLLDEQYIKNHGLLKDIAILLKTIPAILTGKGAY